MRLSIIASAAVFIVIAIFGFGASNSAEQAEVASLGERQGRVLGASEAGSGLSDNLPPPVLAEAEIAPIPTPRRKAGIADFKAEAENYIAIDMSTGIVLAEKNSEKMTPIASLTKLFSALTILDKEIDWSKTYRVASSDIRSGGVNNLAPGDEATREDLLRLALIASDNSAIIALAHSLGLSEEQLVKAMNMKSRELKLPGTIFVDAVGLSDGNLSSAKEVSVIMKLALKNSVIAPILKTENFTLKTANGKQKEIYTTNYLLSQYPKRGISIMGGKTGFTNAAGYCFAGCFAKAGEEGVITVVLDGKTINSRFDITKQLIDWVYASYDWQS